MTLSSQQRKRTLKKRLVSVHVSSFVLCWSLKALGRMPIQDILLIRDEAKDNCWWGAERQFADK